MDGDTVVLGAVVVLEAAAPFLALASSPLGSPAAAPFCSTCDSDEADTVEVDDPTELLLPVEVVRSRFAPVSLSKLKHNQRVISMHTPLRTLAPINKQKQVLKTCPTRRHILP